MSSKHVWRPEASYAPASLGSEEGGRGSLQDSEQVLELKGDRKKKSGVIIPKRRTPTVCIPSPANQNDTETSTPSSDPGRVAIYKTIERNKKQGLLELSHVVYEKSKARNGNWFCGWTDFEALDLHQKPPPTAGTVESGDRSRLQTPLDGYRSTLNSRASCSRYSSSHGRRRVYQYTFHHLDTSEEYAEQYTQLYSFTALNLQKEDDERVCCEGEEVEQDAEVILPLGVKSLYRGDPYLRELVSRLGIREPPPLQDWEKQQQLLMGPRPTPPSIVKRKRNGKDPVDIMVSNSAPKRYGIQYSGGSRI